MGNQNHRHIGIILKFSEFRLTFPLKCLISDGKDFIKEQNIRFKDGYDSKTELGEHPRRIRPHRLIDKFIQFRKFDNLILIFQDFGLGEAEQHAVEHDVFPTRHFRMETGSKLQ